MANNYVSRMLATNEKILLVTRQHWFVLVASSFREIVSILVLIIALVAAGFFLPALIPTAAPFIPILLIILFVLVLIPIISLIRDIMNWYNREFIVTNHRVIQINGIVNKDVIDSSLEKVNDIKLDQSFFGRLFDFGDIEILTASELGVNLFRFIGEPIKFKTAMLNAKDQIEHASYPIPPAPPKEDIPAMIARLDDLRKQGILTEAEFQNKKAELLRKM